MKISTQIAPLFNIFIKGMTLLGKFGLVFYVAKYLEPKDMGVYGLLVSLIFYSLYVVGLDFYTYSTRELVKLAREQWWKYIKSQLCLISVTYLIALPVILYVVSSILEMKWLLFFILLLILEHFNQEIMRLLIVLHRNIWANSLNFIRQGLWCFFLVLLVEFDFVSITLEIVLSIWVGFSAFALLIGFILLIKNIPYSNTENIDFYWIKKGLKICLIFLIATLCTRLVTTLDRIWLEYLSGLAVVGAYSLYMSLTNALIAFLDTGVFSFIYPKMIKDVNNETLFLTHVKKMAFQTTMFTFVISIGLIIITPFLLKWIDKLLYQEYISIFYILLLANSFYCLSMIFHYILYARNEDKKIFYSQLLSLFSFIMFTFCFSMNNIELAVPFGVLVSFVVLFILKAIYAIITLKNKRVL